MSNSPLLSIIIPIYNAEKYIEQCLNSITSLKMTDFEVILIDDGSEDNSNAICERFSSIDKRFKLIKQENSGPSVARNKGIENATGKWISFVDADDWVDKDYAKELEDINVDLVFFGFRRHKNTEVTEAGILNCGNFFDPNEIDCKLVELLQSKNAFFGYTWNKFFKKDLIDKHNIRFKKNLKYKEDEEFTLNYCNYISSLGLRPYVCYNYRILSNSLSHDTNNITAFQYALLSKMLEKDIEYLPFYELKKQFEHKIFYYCFASFIKSDKDEKDHELERLDQIYENYQSDLKFTLKFKLLYSIPSKKLRHRILMLKNN